MRRWLTIAPAGLLLAAGSCGFVEDGRAIYRPEIQPIGWSPDGARVRFVHSELSGGYDYAEFTCGGSGVYETDGSSPPRPVVSGEPWCRQANAWHLEFSPSADGRTVFVLPRNGYGECTAIAGMDLERHTWRETARLCGSSVSHPAASPDGTRIAADLGCSLIVGAGVIPPSCVDRDGERLSVTNADGSPPHVLGEPGDERPAWSLDGRRLAVENLETGTIAIIDLETGVRRIVAQGEHPAWSPDGQWLAFIRFPQDRAERTSLRVIRTDGTGERTVFVQDPKDMRRGPQYPAPGGWPRNPMWSPDGRRIVFTKHFQTGNTLWIVNADGTGLRRLSDRIPPRT